MPHIIHHSECKEQENCKNSDSDSYGDDLHGKGVGERAVQLVVGAAHRPVTRDVGRDERADAERLKVFDHTVGKGDTLSKIAKKYGVSIDKLMKWNKLKNASAIRKGQKLIVKK